MTLGNFSRARLTRLLIDYFGEDVRRKQLEIASGEIKRRRAIFGDFPDDRLRRRG